MSSNETYLTIMPLVSLRITALSSPLLGRAKILPKTTVNIARAVARHSAELASTTEAICIYELRNHLFLQNVLPSTFHREKGVSREIPTDMSKRKPVSNARQLLESSKQLEPPSITHSSFRLLTFQL